MKYSKIKIGTLCLVIFSVSSFLVAAVMSIKTDERFKRFLDNNRFVIAYFYKRTEPGDWVVEHNQDVMRRTSNRRRYHDAGIAFTVVNGARKSSESLLREYGISADNTFVAYLHGKVCSKYYLTGCIGKKDLPSFIEENFSDYIDDAIAEQRQERRQDRRMCQRASCGGCYSCPVFGPGSPYWNWPGYGYCGYGWPYWGYGGYCGCGPCGGCCSPRIGFGMSLCV